MDKIIFAYRKTIFRQNLPHLKQKILLQKNYGPISMVANSLKDYIYNFNKLKKNIEWVRLYTMEFLANDLD